MVTFRTLVRGFGHKVSGDEPQLLVVRGQADWELLWARLNSNSSSFPAAPEVQWNSELVLALILGMRSSTGYQVTIVRLAVNDGGLVVEAREDKPTDFALQMITEPVHVVAAPAADLPDHLTAGASILIS
ncbi:protease complex subunit PrcB family protein [Actinoplanes sp. Pm04-4]|uniref:Protease complex subunit PrcB family protein n=1 Tax=Paractinoplanes pyxinae TaxID=2997416 RepID=A0ABT4BFS2_9ACTN|nr:protease complex subunit PrcB family protein [Actinoplanes pyxinae]MCY1145394.1 protease complex subunit PrcB family protein [Actinoplanes pyxinae]